jgi:cytidylate kinase
MHWIRCWDCSQYIGAITTMSDFLRSEHALLITIDGPGGAGKTTISKLLARRMNYRYLDTGALYRGVAKAAMDKGVSPDDDPALVGLCRDLRLNLVNNELGIRLILNGEDITDSIRAPAVSMMASAVSARPVVRDFLMDIQRAMGREGKVVVEGRDMGTVVFPDADIKFFLTADSKIRARRRFDELSAAGKGKISLKEVEKDMIKRDHDDSSRAVAPLKPAVDAVHIDSTGMTIDQVVEKMLVHIRSKLNTI